MIGEISAALKSEDRQMIRMHLEQAEARVASAERIVARQKLIVDELARRGHDTKVVSRLLEQFERDLKHHINDRDRLRAERDQQQPDRTPLPQDRERLVDAIGDPIEFIDGVKVERREGDQRPEGYCPGHAAAAISSSAERDAD